METLVKDVTLSNERIRDIFNELANEIREKIGDRGKQLTVERKIEEACMESFPFKNVLLNDPIGAVDKFLPGIILGFLLGMQVQEIQELEKLSTLDNQSKENT